MHKKQIALGKSTQSEWIFKPSNNQIQLEWVDRSATITERLEDYIMRSLIHSTIQNVSKKELDNEEYSKLQDMIWILRKQHECLSESDKEKVEPLYKYSPILKKAHRYALQLTSIFNTHCRRKSAMAKLEQWIRKANKNEITCFDRFISTLEKYKPCITNYFKQRKNSSFVEGLNNNSKVTKRQCYELVSIKTIFQRLFLEFQGLEIYA